nr:ABC transporter substrate-binding protein [Periweissella fabaria]
MGGANKVALEKLVAEYNKSQTKYEIIPSFQGTYAENLAKYQSVAGSPSAPDLVQVPEVGTQTMIDNKNYIPAYKLFEQDGVTLNNIEKPISAYYSLDGKLQSIPFNSSTPVMFYNKDVLKSVGYNSFPKTYEEIADIGRKLKEKGSKTKSFSLQVYGWLFEELIANQGNFLMNNDNGKTGVPTKVSFNNADTRYMLTWVQNMLKDGTAVNYSTNENDLTAGFLKQDVAMIFASSSSANQIFKTAKFNVGIGYLPIPEKKQTRTGVAIGGASVWITKGKSKSETNGAWDFMKFMLKPASQAKWSLATGYFPVNKLAYNEDLMKKAYAKNPELQQAANQLHDTKNVPQTQGVLTNVITESRSIEEAGMDSIFNGANVTKTLDKVSTDVNNALLQSNRSNGKLQ